MQQPAHQSKSGASGATPGLSGQRCGYNPVPTHTLRKNFARAVFEATGHDLLRTQRIIGDSSPLVTARYLESTQAELEDVVFGLRVAASSTAGEPKATACGGEHRMVRCLASFANVGLPTTSPSRVWRRNAPASFFGMATTIPFPKGAKLFPLRPDFADELCAFEPARAPLPKTEADEFLAKLGVSRIGTLLIQVLNERRRHFVPGRCIVYYSMVVKQTTTVVPLVSDGPQAVPLKWDESNLLQGLSDKAAESLGVPPWDFTTVFMDPPDAAPEKTLISPSAILHDTPSGLATVMERVAAIEAARLFHDW